MVKGKKRAGKGAAKKASGTSKPRKRAGIGHNKPPEPPVPPPPDIRSWQAQDDGGAAIARWTAARQRVLVAAMNSMSVGPVAPPLAVTNDPATLHQEMRKRIAALEETIAKLPTSPEGLLNDNEIDETKSEIATLKTLPPVPAKFPTEAVRAQSRLAKFGEKVLVGLATTAVSEASKALWAQYGDQLKALARSIGEWIASLPPPP